MSTISTFGTCQICGLIQPKQGQCRDCNGIVNSGGIADPVPPAGYPTAEIAQEAALGVYDIDFPGPDEEVGPVPPAGGDVAKHTPSVVAQLVDLAHITRLQVEVERLAVITRGQRTTIDTIQLRVESLQSELTKARELTSNLRTKDKWGVVVDEKVLLELESMLSNQSAPADKGGDS